MNTPTFRDVEKISALLDGSLSPAETAKLESRLKTDRNLQALMEDLSETRGMLRRMPRRRAPRNFTLTPKMAGVKPPIPRAVPTLRFATLLASFLLVFSLATNALTPSFRQAAQAPAYGMGGGGGGAEGPLENPSVMSAPATEAPAATQPPAAEINPPEATPQPTQAAAASAAADSTERSGLTATPAPFAKGPDQGLAGQPPQPEAASQSLPIPAAWIYGLLAIALISGGLAWLLRWASERSWRAKTK